VHRALTVSIEQYRGRATTLCSASATIPTWRRGRADRRRKQEACVGNREQHGRAAVAGDGRWADGCGEAWRFWPVAGVRRMRVRRDGGKV